MHLNIVLLLFDWSNEHALLSLMSMHFFILFSLKNAPRNDTFGSFCLYLHTNQAYLYRDLSYY